MAFSLPSNITGKLGQRFSSLTSTLGSKNAKIAKLMEDRTSLVHVGIQLLAGGASAAATSWMSGRWAKNGKPTFVPQLVWGVLMAGGTAVGAWLESRTAVDIAGGGLQGTIDSAISISMFGKGLEAQQDAAKDAKPAAA